MHKEREREKKTQPRDEWLGFGLGGGGGNLTGENIPRLIGLVIDKYGVDLI